VSQDSSEQLEITVAKGRKGVLDPADCVVVATVHDDQVNVRIDSGADLAFWMEFKIPLKGTPAAPKSDT